ncbi:MAG: hypothetical protein WB676_11550 [Bryobacteraceae bacterium]
MCTLVMNREHVARLGMAARHHVCRNYSWEKRGPTLAELYSRSPKAGEIQRYPMTTFSLPHRRQLSQILSAAALAVVVLLTGSWVAKAPMKAWLVLASASGLLFFRVDPVYWMAGAVVMAVASRIIAASTGAHFLNFVHYPLVIGGLAVSLIKGRPSALAKAVGAGLMVFLLINFLSWGLNTGELARPIANWLVLAEPFVLVYVMLAAPPTERVSEKLWKLILTLALVQIPLGVWQWRTKGGSPDFVQGTFVHSGTGAHVAGSVALLGVMIAICKGSISRDFRTKTFLFAIAIPLFGLSVLADAKQAIVCFLPGMFIAILCSRRFNPLALLAPLLFTGLISYVAFNYYAPLQQVEDRGLMSAGAGEKLKGLSEIASMLSDHPYSWLFGLGPGNTLSRVALLTPDIDLSDTSLVGLLGLKTSPITLKLVRDTRSSYLSTSSAFSSIGSWFGLLGDLGCVGVLVYLWMVWLLWSGLSRQRNWQSASAKGGIVMMGLLGGVYVWLEEPGFTLVVAMMTGLALAASAYNKAAAPRESPGPAFARQFPMTISR